MKSATRCGALLGIALLALGSQANAALSLTITKKTATEFGFVISGDFSGLATPASGANMLRIVPKNASSVPVTNWLPDGSLSASNRPSGRVNSNVVSGWAYISDTSSSEYRFPGGDTYVLLFSALTSSSVVTENLVLNDVNQNLNPSEISSFDLYWGDTKAASTGAVPEVSSALLGITAAGLFALRRRRQA